MITDFERARTTMVDCQIRTNGVTNHKVIDAFLTVPKEEFISSAQRPLAYIDEDLPLSLINENRYLMESMSMAKLVQLADVTEECIVLDVGCGNGYFGWRMVGAGAKQVIGIDPFLIFVMQFFALRRYLPKRNNWVLPLGIEQLPAELRAFDTTFSIVLVL